MDHICKWISTYVLMDNNIEYNKSDPNVDSKDIFSTRDQIHFKCNEYWSDL